MTNPGDAVPYYGDAIVRRQDDLKRALREQGAARSLAASTIGAGGLTVKDGGSITIEGTGALNVGSGALNSAGSITAATTMTAGGQVQGATLRSTGNTSVGGALAVTGDINVTGDIYTPHGRATPVTSGYVGAWLNVDGRLGATASSVFVKQDFEPANTAALVDALYHVALVRFRYIAAVEQFGDAAVSELGSIAQYFVACGLGEYVFNDADGNPQGINYERLTIPLIAVVQDLDARLKALGG